MKAAVTLTSGGKAFHVLADGRIYYDRWAPSGHWLLTGAIEFGRGYAAGKPVRRYSLEDVIAGRVPWFYKNGKQRCYVCDRDHGSSRVWMSPPLLSVRVANAR